MYQGLFSNGKNEFALGNIKWKATDGSTIRAIFVSYNGYTPDLTNDKWFSDIPAECIKGSGNLSTRESGVLLTLIDPINGVCDAQDLTIEGILANETLNGIIFYKDTGDDSTSPLIAIIDDGAGLPITTNGNDIIIEWNNGANKIFKL